MPSVLQMIVVEVKMMVVEVMMVVKEVWMRPQLSLSIAKRVDPPPAERYRIPKLEKPRAGKQRAVAGAESARGRISRPRRVQEGGTRSS